MRGRWRRPMGLTAAFVLACGALRWSHVTLAPYLASSTVLPSSSWAPAIIAMDRRDQLRHTHRPHAHCETNASAKADRGGFVDYEHLVYCTSLARTPALGGTVLVITLIVLLYLLSSTADSFFCPALQAIVEKYRIPPDIAGVTFLSFGNGSPDVFSNIAAFSTATPKIGVTSILGGGLLVTTVIAASVGLASQDQVQLIPRKYVRDVVFYCIAIAYLAFVFFDGLVSLTKAVGFLCIYACYVSTVLLDAHIAKLYCSLLNEEYHDRDDYKHLLPPFLASSSRSSSNQSLSDLEELAGTPVAMISAYDVYRIPYGNSASDSDHSETSVMFPKPGLFRKSSAPTPRSNRHEGFGEDPGKLHEGTPLLLRQNTLARPASVCVPALSRRHRRHARSVWEATSQSAHFNLAAKRWTRGYHLQLSGIDEFRSRSEMGDDIIGEEEAESETDVSDKSSTSGSKSEVEGIFYRYCFKWLRIAARGFENFVWDPLEFSTTFIRRLTIPLVDEDTWDKDFSTVCPPFAILVVGATVFNVDPLTSPLFCAVVAVGGGLGSLFVYFTASRDLPPEGLYLAPYICLAFVMSVVWIMNVANEVLAVLEVLGGLFGISNSVLGVSVLAWGNSVGDLVSNTAIARDGFPTMAFAGCFAGPMFNLLVGIGLALTIAIVQRGPLSMGKPSTLVYLGFCFLFLSLSLNLGLAARDGFRYRPQLCYGLLVFYVGFAVLSVIVVLSKEE